MHDLGRILGSAHHIRVPAPVPINKADVSLANTGHIETYCRDQGIELAGCLPYDDTVTRAMVQRQTATCCAPEGEMTRTLRKVWARVREHLDGAG